MSRINSHQKFVFVADDDEDDRLLFLDAVTDLDMPIAVKLAEDGQQLLDELNTALIQLPEIIFLDINMPGKNGFDCLKEIRTAQKNFHDVRVVMLSTSSSPLNIDLSYQLGADFYAIKPGSFEDLKNLLRKIFEIDWINFKKDEKKFLLA
ncbi:response regulator [Flavobacterium artemisiae]|uniref:Response regulator n=1 Tax=Flavobacterium artemisiae TaxID=2126556 RepID=A0ABW4HGY4_9FLAO